MKAVGVALVLMATSSVHLQACDWNAGHRTFEYEAARIERTLQGLSHVKLLQRSEMRRADLIVAQTWWFTIEGNWSSHLAAVESALSPPYRCAREAISMLCNRALPGDHLRLHVEPETRDGLQISRAELVAGAD